MGYLYKLTFPSKRSYIGITLEDISTRIDWHVKKSRRKHPTHAIARAIKKYGENSFSIEILAEEPEEHVLRMMEMEAILIHDTYVPNGYNMTLGGDGVLGLCEESKKLHSINTSIGTKNAWDNGTLRENRAKVWNSDEFKILHSKKTSEGTRLAFSDPIKHKAMIDSHRTQEYRSKASASMVQLWKDPAFRADRIAKRREQKPRTETSKQAQSEKMKEYIRQRKAAGTYWL